MGSEVAEASSRAPEWGLEVQMLEPGLIFRTQDALAGVLARVGRALAQQPARWVRGLSEPVWEECWGASLTAPMALDTPWWWRGDRSPI